MFIVYTGNKGCQVHCIKCTQEIRVAKFKYLKCSQETGVAKFIYKGSTQDLKVQCKVQIFKVYAGKRVAKSNV